jgi:hypothetical protein
MTRYVTGMRAIIAGLAILVVFVGGCGGPCKQIARERAALLGRSDSAPGAHARIQVPFAIANAMLAELVKDEPELPLDYGKLGPLAAFVPHLRGIVQGVELVPADPGKVGFAVRVSIVDDTGELLALLGRGDAAPVIEHAPDGGTKLAVPIRADQLTRLEPELGPRAAGKLGELLAKRLPSAVRDRTPQFLIDRIAKEVAEEAATQAYRLLRGAALKRIGELTTLRFGLPPAPIARVDVESRPGPVPALELAIVTALPVRAALAVAPPAEPDAVTVAISGSAAVELANWSIAHGRAPQRYTRSLEPARDGTYVPHFDWRAGDAERPLVVHMFKVEDGCAHFAVGAKPFVEVRDGKISARIENKRLEAADASLAFATLARIKGAFDDSTSPTKQVANVAGFTIGDRDVTTRLVRAEVAGDDIRVSVAVALGAHHSDHAPTAKSDH